MNAGPRPSVHAPLLIPAEEIAPGRAGECGGKAASLARLSQAGFSVPTFFCLTVHAYRLAVGDAGLDQVIREELRRKPLDRLRWEELWDIALRLRNRFLILPLPETVRRALADAVLPLLENGPVAVRSSAPGEDSAAASFAGLHESRINLRTPEQVEDAVRLVWASLWSDAALLYRREIGLDADSSAMAVVVQQMVAGDASGVLFTRDPDREDALLLEAVHGLNQGLVDGSVEPDRWRVLRDPLRILSHHAPVRDRFAAPAENGAELHPLSPERSARPPLDDAAVLELSSRVLGVETLFGAPQDVEWTRCARETIFLQARPITTLADTDADPNRRWYLTLRRSFENLRALRPEIEERVLPGMLAAARELRRVLPDSLQDADLARLLRERAGTFARWKAVYWEKCIPFAHAVRLFGQVYNDLMRPSDPYEFMRLLEGGELASLGRNRALETLAEDLRSDETLRQRLTDRDFATLPPAFAEKIDAFVARFGDLSCPVTGLRRCGLGLETLAAVLLEMADHPRTSAPDRADKENLTRAYLQAGRAALSFDPLELLDLARAGHRLRDDDNHALGKLETLLMQAREAALERLGEKVDRKRAYDDADLARALVDPEFHPLPRKADPEAQPGELTEQAGPELVGQPAVPGVAQGPARVIREAADLAAFRSGDILVCDALDPTMTFVLPLAAAIVERRGGMLIHGAIIAREYGIPCVTGIPHAVRRIATGDRLTVDGFRGTVTLHGSSL